MNTATANQLLKATTFLTSSWEGKHLSGKTLRSLVNESAHLKRKDFLNNFLSGTLILLGAFGIPALSIYLSTIHNNPKHETNFTILIVTAVIQAVIMASLVLWNLSWGRKCYRKNVENMETLEKFRGAVQTVQSVWPEPEIALDEQRFLPQAIRSRLITSAKIVLFSEQVFSEARLDQKQHTATIRERADQVLQHRANFDRLWVAVESLNLFPDLKKGDVFAEAVRK